MLITKRDIELLNWINRFGYVTVEQVARYWQVSKVTAYGRMKKLVREGYLQHQRFLYQSPGLYWDTKMGVQLTCSQLPPIRNISLATIRHQLAVVDVSLQVAKKHDISFVTERELRHIDGQQGVGRKVHFPDALLIKDDEKIALEVELTTKSQKRIVQILNQYRKNFDYQSVWYFCGNNEVWNKLNKQVPHYPFLKVQRLGD